MILLTQPIIVTFLPAAAVIWDTEGFKGGIWEKWWPAVQRKARNPIETSVSNERAMEKRSGSEK